MFSIYASLFPPWPWQLLLFTIFLTFKKKLRYTYTCALSLSRVWLFVTSWLSRVLFPWYSPGKNTGVDSYSLLQGIFPTQGWKLGLLHGRWIKHSSFEREGHSLISLRTAEAHQETTWVQIKEQQARTHPDPCQQLRVWTIAVKLLTKSSLVWTHSLEDVRPLWPLLPGKAIRLFFCISSKM